MLRVLRGPGGAMAALEHQGPPETFFFLFILEIGHWLFRYTSINVLLLDYETLAKFLNSVPKMIT